VIDPAQGFVASWNNRPQASWPDSGDGSLWGGIQRVRQPQSLLAAQPRLDQIALWQVARRTGELDLRATLGFKPFLAGLASRADLSATERAAVTLVSGWDGTAFYPDGAERTASGQETGNVASPAFAILNAWFAALESRVAAPVFGPVVDGQNAEAGLRAFTETPATTSPQYEFYDDYDEFLYDVLTGRAHAAGYLGGLSAFDVSRLALGDAVRQLSASQGNDPARWRAPMPQINFQALDVAGVPSIPWENRGTWGQAVALPPAPPGSPPRSAGCSLAIAIHGAHGRRVVRVAVYAGGRLVRTAHGRSIRRIVVTGLPAGSFRMRIVARTRGGQRRVSVRRYRNCRPAGRTSGRRRSRRGRRASMWRWRSTSPTTRTRGVRGPTRSTRP
jgi:hypothetical protein